LAFPENLPEFPENLPEFSESLPEFPESLPGLPESLPEFPDAVPGPPADEEKTAQKAAVSGRSNDDEMDGEAKIYFRRSAGRH
jgi:hypothetical protein